MFDTTLTTEFIQSKIIELIDYLDKTFTENDIWYSLSCGSVLGAVRHQGFIPWDEDMDIFIKIEDLEKVRRTIVLSLPDGMCLQNYDSDACGGSHDKLYFTAFPDELIHLDIFPLIGAPDLLLKRFFFVKYCHYINRVFRCKYAVGYFIKGSFKKAAFKLIKLILLLVPDAVIRTIYHKLEQAYPVSEAHYLTYIANEGSVHECIPKNIYFDIIRVPFKQLNLPIPRDFHFYLSSIYGHDYMTPKKY